MDAILVYKRPKSNNYPNHNKQLRRSMQSMEDTKLQSNLGNCPQFGRTIWSNWDFGENY